MKIGTPVFKAMATAGPDYISSDCALAGHHIAQGMAGQVPRRGVRHPLSLVAWPTAWSEASACRSPATACCRSRLTRRSRRCRPGHRAPQAAQRCSLGEHINLQFEDEQTIRRQIQEMLHIEKIFDEDGIESEIDAYAPLVPDGSNWKATMLIEYPDVNERRRELARLIGVEDRLFVEVEGHARVYAIADEDLDRETDEKTSAVHFLRFGFAPAAARPLRAGAASKLGCDHTHYPAHVAIARRRWLRWPATCAESDRPQLGIFN